MIWQSFSHFIDVTDSSCCLFDEFNFFDLCLRASYLVSFSSRLSQFFPITMSIVSLLSTGFSAVLSKFVARSIDMLIVGDSYADRFFQLLLFL